MKTNIQQTPELRRLLVASQKPIDYDPEQLLCERMNEAAGDKTGYDCPVCKNKGVNYRISAENGSIVAVPCSCIPIRETVKNAKSSGLGDLISKCTLSNFRTDHEWQKKAFETAKKFLSDPDGKWLFAGGQVGSGKTHLCTAVVRQLLGQGKRALYVIWRTEAQYLRSRVNEDEYRKRVDKLSEVPVLYIDDFLKIENGEYQRPKLMAAPVPTSGDKHIAFDIINARYNRSDSITLISSEHFLDEINAFESAVASRIMERCHGGRFVIEIGRSVDRNMRYSNDL